MSQTETLMLLASQVEERRKVVLDDLGLGVRDHLAYVSAVGEMAGYMRVQQLISEMIQAGKTEDEAFERERKIVEEEWRSDLGATKRYLDKFYPYLYRNSLLLERLPIGDIEVIRNFKYEDARDYYRKWYQPNLMGLFVIGDVDVNQITVSYTHLTLPTTPYV